MADYKVPGVYVEEPFGLSLSIQTGETAVPVFAFGSAVSWGGAFGQSDSSVINNADITEFTSWLDVISVRQRFAEKAARGITDPAEKEKKVKEMAEKFDQDVKTDLLYQSLKLYFLNGGGHCYVAPVASLQTLVPALDDVTLLVQAGTDMADFKSAVGTLCKTGNTLFAIYDGPNKELSKEADVSTEQSSFPSNAYAAVYYPWLFVEGVVNPVPPSGAVAGVFARVDRERGVWKAPANVGITGAVPAFKVSDTVDGACNAPTTGGQSFNVIRQFRGTGPLVWGARTLKSDDASWKFVPVRRLFNAAEKDIRAAMSMAVFEPNSAPTWERVRGAVESYVHGLWKQGALLGDTPAQAYKVEIGLGTTMTQAEINAGKMVLRVALAAVRPAEFIVLELTQDVVPG